MVKGNYFSRKTIFREGFIVILGQIITILGTLVFLKIITNQLDPKEFGLLAIFMTFTVLIDHLIMGGITNAVGRLYSEANLESDVDLFVKASIVICIYASLVILSIASLVAIILVILHYSNIIIPLLITALYSFINGCNSIFSSIQNASRKRGLVAFHNFIGAWLRIPVVFFSLKYLGHSVTFIITAYCFASFLVLISQSYFLNIFKVIRNDADSDYWVKKIIKFALPFSQWGLFTFSQQSSDRLGLQFFSNTFSVGLYSVLYQLAFVPISTLTGLVMSFISPILYDHYGKGDDRSRSQRVHNMNWKIFSLGISISFIIFLFLIYFHSSVLLFFTSAKFNSKSYLLPWIFLSACFVNLAQILSLKNIIQLKPEKIVNAKVYTSILGIIFNFAGVFFNGVDGLVFAQLCFSMVLLFWIFILYEYKKN